MAGPAKILGPAGKLCHFPGRDRPFHGGDPRGGIDMVNGDGKSRFMVIGIPADHLRELEPVYGFPVHGHTDQSLTLGGHKVHR